MDPSSSELAEFNQAMSLTPEEAAALESGLKERPEDPRARVRLMGYYFLASITSPEATDALTRHALWLIHHAPTEAVLRTPFASLEGLDVEGPEAWKEQLARYPTSAAVHANAARFFTGRDAVLADTLLARARELEPSGDWEWKDLLQKPAVPTASRSPEALEQELAAQPAGLRRFHLITRLLMVALPAEDLERVGRYAREALELAPGFPEDWNHGNGLFQGHTGLGLLALARGDVEAAVQHLLSSARTPGSPQLNSFGPDLTLARKLLALEQREAVRTFLERCQDFWELGRAKLHSWLEALRTGQTPELR